MLGDRGLLHIPTVNRGGLTLALVQHFLLSSAHIPWLDGAWCLISFSVPAAPKVKRLTHRRSHGEADVIYDTCVRPTTSGENILKKTCS